MNEIPNNDHAAERTPDETRKRAGRRAVIWGVVTVVSLLLCVVMYIGPFASILAGAMQGVVDVPLDEPAEFERDDWSGRALLFRREGVSASAGEVVGAIRATDANGDPLPLRESEGTTLTIMSESYVSVAAIDLSAAPPGGVFTIDATGMGDRLSEGDLALGPDLFGENAGLLVAGVCGSCVLSLLFIAGLVMTIINVVQFASAPRA